MEGGVTVLSNGYTRRLVLLLLIVMPLAGCETVGSTGVGTRTAIGGLGGAAAGGLLAAALGGKGPVSLPAPSSTVSSA
jgi:hypothetical protein